VETCLSIDGEARPAFCWPESSCVARTSDSFTPAPHSLAPSLVLLFIRLRLPPDTCAALFLEPLTESPLSPPFIPLLFPFLSFINFLPFSSHFFFLSFFFFFYPTAALRLISLAAFSLLCSIILSILRIIFLPSLSRITLSLCPPPPAAYNLQFKCFIILPSFSNHLCC
jgi:hypothetical protein